MAIKTLRDLYVQELKDGWSANRQMAEVVSEMVAVVENDQLADMLKETVARIGDHNDTLQTLIEEQDEDVSDEEFCRGMQGLVREARKHALDAELPPALRDVAVISQVQRMSHYGIAHYGTARALADALGLEEDVEDLQADLDSVYSGDNYLTYLAESQVNRDAEELEDDDEAVDEEDDRDDLTMTGDEEPDGDVSQARDDGLPRRPTRR